MVLKNNWKNDIVRFNVERGPNSLFERVMFKMKDVHTLKFAGRNFLERMKDKNIPDELYKKLQNFDISECALKTAEVRKDKGKFYNSTWEYTLNGKRYWVTIGLGNVITNIVQRDLSGYGNCIVKGEIYDFVEKVNRDLMDAEK